MKGNQNLGSAVSSPEGHKREKKKKKMKTNN